MQVSSDQIKVLDVTLRDGGHVNNFNFGEKNIQKIVDKLSKSKIDAIELGFLMDGNHSVNQSRFNHISEVEKFLINHDSLNEYFVMIRPDWYDISNLEKACGRVKNIRFAFYYKDLELTFSQAIKARELGYKVYLNPINVFSYSQYELEDLLKKLNVFCPSAISIVDTFGCMQPKDLDIFYSIFNRNIDKEIAIGLHLHENLSLSFALAQQFIKNIDNSRNYYIDSSLAGMGRIPGNLCTELILQYLNTEFSKEYNLENVYSLITDPISDIRKRIPWGYLPAYGITAFLKVHRSYAEYLLEKPRLSLDDIYQILSNIKNKNDREFFNKDLLNSLYSQFLIEKEKEIPQEIII